MSLHKRILDMLPVLLVFAAVSAFATYVIIAYIERDPFWLQTLAQHGGLPSNSPATPAQPAQAAASHAVA